jgi:hypothetical protein
MPKDSDRGNGRICACSTALVAELRAAVEEFKVRAAALEVVLNGANGLALELAGQRARVQQLEHTLEMVAVHVRDGDLAEALAQLDHAEIDV